MSLAKEASILSPILHLILSCRSSTACARLLEQLEDKLLTIFFRWLRHFIEKKPRFRLSAEDESATKTLLSPYKKEFTYLSAVDWTVAKKRKYLNRLNSRDSFFHRVLSSLAQTLQGIVIGLSLPPSLKAAASKEIEAT
ncbi:MAG: hypothetical protein AAGE99_05045 [Chlamydiota bacterium]